MILRQITDEVALKPINYIQTGSIDTVPDSVQTTIITLTATQNHNIFRISCSGDVYAKYQLYVNSDLIETKRIGNRDIDFIFNTPLQVLNGQILDVKVTHYYIGKTVNFDATIYSRV